MSLFPNNYFQKHFTDSGHASLLLADEIEELCAYLELPLRLGELGVTVSMAGELGKGLDGFLYEQESC